MQRDRVYHEIVCRVSSAERWAISRPRLSALGLRGRHEHERTPHSVLATLVMTLPPSLQSCMNSFQVLLSMCAVLSDGPSAMLRRLAQRALVLRSLMITQQEWNPEEHCRDLEMLSELLSTITKHISWTCSSPTTTAPNPICSLPSTSCVSGCGQALALTAGANSPCASFLHSLAHFHESSLLTAALLHELRQLAVPLGLHDYDRANVTRQQDIEDYLRAHTTNLTHCMQLLDRATASSALAGLVLVSPRERSLVNSVVYQERSMVAVWLTAFLKRSGQRALTETELHQVRVASAATDAAIQPFLQKLVRLFSATPPRELSFHVPLSSAAVGNESLVSSDHGGWRFYRNTSLWGTYAPSPPESEAGGSNLARLCGLARLADVYRAPAFSTQCRVESSSAHSAHLCGVFVRKAAVPIGWLYLPGLDSPGGDCFRLKHFDVQHMADLCEYRGLVAFNTWGCTKRCLVGESQLVSFPDPQHGLYVRYDELDASMRSRYPM